LVGQKHKQLDISNALKKITFFQKKLLKKFVCLKKDMYFCTRFESKEFF